MSKASQESFASLSAKARLALGLSQNAYGAKLGWSLRTQARYESGRSAPSPDALVNMGELVHPVNAGLGEELIKRGQALAIKHGLTPRKPVNIVLSTESSTALTLPPSRKLASGSARTVEAKAIEMRHLVDAVVCAATDEGDLRPRDVRPILLAAFSRAIELGLEMEEVRRVLLPGKAGTRKRSWEE